MRSPPPTPNHQPSILGLVSFALSLLYVVCVLALKMIVSSSYILKPEEYIGFILVGLIALGLGILGLYQPRRDRLFPWLGIVINSACLITTLADLWLYWSKYRY